MPAKARRRKRRLVLVGARACNGSIGGAIEAIERERSCTSPSYQERVRAKRCGRLQKGVFVEVISGAEEPRYSEEQQNDDSRRRLRAPVHPPLRESAHVHLEWAFLEVPSGSRFIHQGVPWRSRLVPMREDETRGCQRRYWNSPESCISAHPRRPRRFVRNDIQLPYPSGNGGGDVLGLRRVMSRM
ncbi:hypothetical protein SCP_0413350 [Sparassis crispa]|uniref:Uncharacterized protein n=1 Tax=Sparassis crispa TaxID=139825 RepID=A0A401GLA2_9APHY|nr:hypothetical protein SCP_0413350 [Sparassis crispa]GBE82948.1 hypothetical protein SCP_0413350 [Sparassis crispa]